ncbi:TIGR00341 family protein [Halopelagius inordinatus]|uniref:TIGR00341 family protein n=1 Tax=Halopelagius inordinatus TaxID=553467 RepID=A0A1I2UWN4_9EURY|nr:TIGR00341 family protein [Halopelagius inordinatus]SFG81470.1 TIGR00341 family protein [Halopelagius inordinatus]
MRRIQVLVSDDQLGDVTDVLDDEGIDYVRYRAQMGSKREEQWLVEIPLPTDAIGYVLDRFEDAGVESDQYLSVESLESSVSPRSEELKQRFADDFDPLTQMELRSKAQDMSRDTFSFLAMIFLSAVIAAGGLLVDSPAVVVGSMVIAPIVGPVMTASVGAVTGDRKMLANSIWIQAAGLVTGIVAAGAFSYVLLALGFVPSTLDITSVELIGLRISPGFVTMVVGLTAGAAGAFGITTKGPTSLIGVMIAAALIPAAATVGIALAWGEYRIAVGSLLLLLVTVLLINLGAFAVLLQFYGPDEKGWLFPSDAPRKRRLLLVGTALAVVLVAGVVGVAAGQQLLFERTATGVVEDTLSQPEYGDTEPVAVRFEYGDGFFPGPPETVTVVASRTAGGGDPPSVAGELDRRITEVTGRDVAVRVRFQEYQRSESNASRSLSPTTLAPSRTESSPVGPRAA